MVVLCLKHSDTLCAVTQNWWLWVPQQEQLRPFCHQWQPLCNAETSSCLQGTPLKLSSLRSSFGADFEGSAMAAEFFPPSFPCICLAVRGVGCFAQWAPLARVPCGPGAPPGTGPARSRGSPWGLSGQGLVAGACPTVPAREEGSWGAALVLDIGLQGAPAQRYPEDRAVESWRLALLWHHWGRDWRPWELTWGPGLWAAGGSCRGLARTCKACGCLQGPATTYAIWIFPCAYCHLLCPLKLLNSKYKWWTFSIGILSYKWICY